MYKYTYSPQASVYISTLPSCKVLNSFIIVIVFNILFQEIKQIANHIRITLHLRNWQTDKASPDSNKLVICSHLIGQPFRSDLPYAKR